MKTIEFWLSLIGAIVLAFIIAIWVPGDAQEKVTKSIEYAGLIIVFLFGFMVLAGIASGKIDISKLLTEDGGGASMSRFQLLVFTFVIALSLLLIVVNNKTSFPDIPANVLLLLGISATTYGVSKGIQASSDQGLKGKDSTKPPNP
ncbi:MAG TPA: hypothetical protein VI685_07730 [Candidatus Angelobacter sp.]